MKNIPVWLLLFVSLSSCQSPGKFLEEMQKLDATDSNQRYTMKLNYTYFIVSGKGDKATRMKALHRLIDLKAYAPARYGIAAMLEEDPGNDSLYYLRAVCLENEFHPRKALAALSRAMESGGEKPGYREMESRLRENLSVWNEIRTLDSLVRCGERSPDAYNRRAQNLVRLRLFEPARYDADQSLSLDSTSAEACFIKGVAFLLSHRYKKADSVLTMLGEKNMEIPADQEEIYRNYMRIAENLVRLESRMQSHPGEVKTYIDMSRELSMVLEYDRAISVIDKGLTHNKNDNRLLHAKLFLYIRKGDRQGAIDQLHYIESLGLPVDEEIRKLLEQ